MLKIFAWVVSNDGRFVESAIEILERQHNGLQLVGKASGDDIAKIDGVGGVYDVLLVFGAQTVGMSKITQAARQLRLPEEKLLGDWIVCIPGFTLDKYRRLQRSRLSIFAMNCFGGLISHTLGLPFRTPIIDMFFKEQEYIRFLRSSRTHMKKNLTLKKMVCNDVFKYHYPIVTLGDVEIIMNHYRDFDEALNIWNERKQKINWYNLFVTMYTDSKEILEQFDALPYGKKVCFVPFKSDLDSAWYINPEIDFDRAEPGFYDVVNNFARGKHFYYDPFDMLLCGRKTQLIDM